MDMTRKFTETFRVALLMGGVALAAGCTSVPSISPSRATNEEGIRRVVKVNTAGTIKNNWTVGRLFALIQQNGEKWELLSVDARYPIRQGTQEVFLITRDLKSWETTIPPEKYCDLVDVGYTVCTSILAKSGLFGVKRYDVESVKKAVYSIEFEQARAVVEGFIESETNAKKVADEEIGLRQTRCYERHKEESHQIYEAAGRAAAAAISGKQLGSLEMAQLRQGQQRMSATADCGYIFNQK